MRKNWYLVVIEEVSPNFKAGRSGFQETIFPSNSGSGETILNYKTLLVDSSRAPRLHEMDIGCTSYESNKSDQSVQM